MQTGRAELVGLSAEDLQMRGEHWVIVSLISKGKPIPTVPVPTWPKRAIDEWTQLPVLIMAGSSDPQVGSTKFGRRNRVEIHLAGRQGAPAYAIF
jgi:hypothetical protein